jgi:HSP20 family protein
MLNKFSIKKGEIIMTLLKFDPYRSIEGAMKKMSRFVNEVEKGVTFETGGFNPRVDIFEDEKNLFVHAEFPGMEKSGIKIMVNEDRMLTIKGEKSKLATETERTPIRSERIYGSFERHFILPEFVDWENIEATFNNGVLELKLSKKEPEKPKEIEVTIS